MNSSQLVPGVVFTILLPWLWLDIISPESSGLGYDNIPWICKALKGRILLDIRSSHGHRPDAFLTNGEVLLSCFTAHWFAFAAIYQHLPYLCKGAQLISSFGLSARLLGACLWPYITGDNNVFSEKQSQESNRRSLRSFPDYFTGLFPSSRECDELFMDGVGFGGKFVICYYFK